MISFVLHLEKKKNYREQFFEYCRAPKRSLLHEPTKVWIKRKKKQAIDCLFVVFFDTSIDFLKFTLTTTTGKVKGRGHLGSALLSSLAHPSIRYPPVHRPFGLKCVIDVILLFFPGRNPAPNYFFFARQAHIILLLLLVSCVTHFSQLFTMLLFTLLSALPRSRTDNKKKEARGRRKQGRKKWKKA